jgi:signal transduction histidine kinase
MLLSDFIASHIEQLAAEHEAFARSVNPVTALDSSALRDHAGQVLRTFVVDMRTPQSKLQQAEKSKGRQVRPGLCETAAQQHGSQRAELGFHVDHITAEYRALRASVVRLWLETGPAMGSAEIDELVRFNEAVDQAVAESMERFTMAAARDRALFIGVLSHELRTPLGTVMASGHALRKAASQNLVLPKVIDRTLRSAARIANILNDMLDFVQGEMQGGMRVQVRDTDMDMVGERVVMDARLRFPDRKVNWLPAGNATGEWDENRIAQALANLINNAVKYSDPDHAVDVKVSCDAKNRIVVAVRNRGEPIPTHRLETFFRPFVRGAPDRADAGLGLGLYVVKEIAMAHGGNVHAISTAADGTMFSLVLPRQMASESVSAFGQLGRH